MEKIEDLKVKWKISPSKLETYNTTTMNNLVKSRVNKHMRKAFQFFWASFALQIVVYALLAHVIVRYHDDLLSVILAIIGILLYIPFTHVLLKKFKQMAFMPTVGRESTIEGYVNAQRGLMEGFLSFKKTYELFLVPISCGIGVFLTFKLYVPGGAYAYPQGALITFAITLLSCFVAIKRENERNLIKPIADLREILNGYKTDFEQQK